MTRLADRLDRMERRATTGAASFQHVHADGWVKLCRGGKVIFALPDNGRDPAKVTT